MRKKTESLTFPKDPLATMRELQELNAPRTTPDAERAGRPAATEPSAGARAHESGEPAESRPSLQEAILHVLSSPYPSNLARGPFTVTSVKLHTEIWNRLGLAATLTGRTKQEMMAEALRTYLDTLCGAYSGTASHSQKTDAAE